MTVLDFFKDYTTQVKQFATDTLNIKDQWGTIQNGNVWCNCIIEQTMFIAVAEQRKSKIEYLIDAEEGEEGQAQAVALGYTHLNAGSKHNRGHLKKLENRMRRDYPDLFARCLSIAQEMKKKPLISMPSFLERKIKLSVVIPVLNDNKELNATLDSLRETAGNPALYEAVIIDDWSDQPAVLEKQNQLPNFQLHRNDMRIGAAQSRHRAAEIATGDYLFLIDAHSRFAPNWLENAMERIIDRPQTMHNAVCLGLDYEKADCLENAVGRYCGASLLIYQKETGEVFEGKWNKYNPMDDEEISCTMGACYFIPRPWFFKIGGLKSLRMWGCEEQYLSLKCWMAGGEIRFLNMVELGHKFRSKAPYCSESWNILYNKIRMWHELLDTRSRDRLMRNVCKYPTYGSAMKQIWKDWDDIADERRYYQSIIVRDFDWYCHKFELENPLNHKHEHAN